LSGGVFRVSLVHGFLEPNPLFELGIISETLTNLESNLLATTDQDQMSGELMRGHRLNPLILKGPEGFDQYTCFMDLNYSSGLVPKGVLILPQ
jgi:hypothetical protein